jgi:hypothetical protein
MQQTLKHIETLLRKYEFTLEANIVVAVKELYSHDPDKACAQMIAPSWWVGEDAVAEVNMSIAGGFSSKSRRDQDNFQQLIISLYEDLSAAGYESDHAKLVTSLYHKWLASRV